LTTTTGPGRLVDVKTRQPSLFAELRQVHDMLRRDLAAVRKVAAAAAGGRPVPEIRGDLRAMHTRSLLFQLKAGCLGYCQLVHSHHGGEDDRLFPVIRRAAPHLAATIDRLKADHRVVADLLDQVEGAARSLGDDADARTRLVDALGALSAHLHEHLAFEEQALEPVLATWTRWP
jgi:hypothetical protein